MDTIKKNIVIDKKIGREVSQLLLEGDIIVPDIKPDMDVLLQKSANAYIDSREIINNRINFKGALDIEVLYIAKSEGKPIHSMSSSMPINDFITMDGIDGNMLVSTVCSITNIDYKIVNDRKVSFRAVLDVTAEVMMKESCDVIVDVEGIPESQVIKYRMKLNRLVAGKNDRFIIKDEALLPSGKPNIRQLLQSRIYICGKEVKAGRDKVNISGELKICTLYKSDEDEGIIEYVENEIPFNGSIEADGAEEGMMAEALIDIQDKFVQVRPDSDGEDRALEVEVALGCRIRVSSEEEIEILEDVYCINQSIEMNSKEIVCPVFLCRNKNQTSIKEILKLDEICPPILQIVTVSGQARLDEVKVVEDKVVAEGIIEADIMYVTESDAMPVYSYSAVIPYRQVIETRGTAPDKSLIVNIDTSVENFSVNMLSDKEVELRCVIDFDVCVQEETACEIINELIFSDMDKELLDKIASMTIYVVQKGDTLWKIAKRYNTSIDELAAINDIENPDKIYPGQRLLILKKI